MNKYRKLLRRGPVKIFICLFLVLFTTESAYSLPISGTGEAAPYSAAYLPGKDKGSAGNEKIRYRGLSYAVPSRLASTEKVFVPGNEKLRPPRVVFHIEDAHCNYHAQKKIAQIIDHLYEEYGITAVNLEGGKGEYDLSAFQGIKDASIRLSVGDILLRQGILSAAEFYKATEGKKIRLWGVEDESAYNGALDTFRAIKNAGAELEDILDGLKKDIVLLEREFCPPAYREIKELVTRLCREKEDFRKNFGLLWARMREYGIVPGPNMKLMRRVLQTESSMDTARVEEAREDIIESLSKVLSDNEKKDLAHLLDRVLSGETDENELYVLLINKSMSAGLENRSVHCLKSYLEYRRTAEKIDTGALMLEIRRTGREIVPELCVSRRQKEIASISICVDALGSLLRLELTSEEFKMLRERLSGQDVFAAMRRLAGEHTSFDPAPVQIDVFRRAVDRALTFYDEADVRDRAFLDNMIFLPASLPFYGERRTGRAAVLITGGFHSRNLEKLFAGENIAYVRLYPAFSSPEGYESPYYSVITGKEDSVLRKMDSEVFALAVCSLVSELFPGAGKKETLERTVRVLGAVMGGRSIRIKDGEQEVLFSPEFIEGARKIKLENVEIYALKHKRGKYEHEWGAGTEVRPRRSFAEKAPRSGPGAVNIAEAMNILRRATGLFTGLVSGLDRLDRYIRMAIKDLTRKPLPYGVYKEIDLAEDKWLAETVNKIYAEAKTGILYKKLKVIPRLKVERKIKASFEFLSKYSYRYKEKRVDLIEKKLDLRHWGNTLKDFVSLNMRKGFNVTGKGGLGPFFIPEGQYKVLELDLQSFGYRRLSTLVREDRILFDSELRKEIQRIVSSISALRVQGHFFRHNHLHQDNILLKLDREGGVEDIRIIDWTRLSVHEEAPDKSERKTGWGLQVDVHRAPALDETYFAEGADLQGVSYNEGSLNFSALYWCDLSGSDLSGSSMFRSIFTGCDLSGSDLRRVKMMNSDLTFTNMRNTDLRESDVAEADLSYADLSYADLRGVKNLATSRADYIILKNTVFDKNLAAYFLSIGFNVRVLDDRCLVSNHLGDYLDRKKDFQCVIAPDAEDRYGRSYYSGAPEMDGQVPDEEELRELRESVADANPDGIISAGGGPSFMLVRDPGRLGGIPLIVQRKLFVKLKNVLGLTGDNDLAGFIADAFMKRYYKEPEKAHEIIRRLPRKGLVIAELDSSGALFEDHRRNGFIGMNRAVLERVLFGYPLRRKEVVLKALLATGLCHEIEHEAGMHDEVAMTETDAAHLISYSDEDKEITAHVLRAFLPVSSSGPGLLSSLIKEEMAEVATDPELRNNLFDLLEPAGKKFGRAGMAPDKWAEDELSFYFKQLLTVDGVEAGLLVRVARSIMLKEVSGPAAMCEVLDDTERSISALLRTHPHAAGTLLPKVCDILRTPALKAEDIPSVFNAAANIMDHSRSGQDTCLDRFREIISMPAVRQDNIADVIRGVSETVVDCGEASAVTLLNLRRILENSFVHPSSFAEIFDDLTEIAVYAAEASDSLTGFMARETSVSRYTNEELKRYLKTFKDIAYQWGRLPSVVRDGIAPNINAIISSPSLRPERTAEAIMGLHLLSEEDFWISSYVNALLNTRKKLYSEFYRRPDTEKINDILPGIISSAGDRDFLRIMSSFRPLSNVDIGTNGNASNDSSVVASSILSSVPDMPGVHRLFIEEKPVVTGEAPTVITPEDISGETGSGELLYQGAIGRTLMFRSADGGYIAVKIKKEQESREAFLAEAMRIEDIRKHRRELGIGHEVPRPLKLKNGFVFRFDLSGRYAEKTSREQMVSDLEENLEQARRAGKGFSLDPEMTAYAYRLAPASGLNEYLNSASQGSAIRGAILNAAGELGRLASKGYLHTALTGMFHNLSGRHPEERRYVWTIEMDESFGRQGAGRVTAWRESCKWPNISADGALRDLGEIAFVDDIIAAPERYTGLNGVFLARGAETHRRNRITMHFLGEYAMSLVHLYAEWAGSHGGLPDLKDGERTGELADFLRAIYGEMLTSFTGKEKSYFEEGVLRLVDWDSMARQISFFMGRYYIEYLDENGMAADGEDIWQLLYPEAENITCSKLGAHYFNKITGYKGDPGEKGVAGTAESLGAYNGIYPVTELITANYLLFSLGVAENAFERSSVGEYSLAGELAEKIHGDMYGRSGGISSDLLEERINMVLSYAEVKGYAGMVYDIEELFTEISETGKFSAENIMPFLDAFGAFIAGASKDNADPVSAARGILLNNKVLPGDMARAAVMLTDIVRDSSVLSLKVYEEVLEKPGISFRDLNERSAGLAAILKPVEELPEDTKKSLFDEIALLAGDAEITPRNLSEILGFAVSVASSGGKYAPHVLSEAKETADLMPLPYRDVWEFLSETTRDRAPVSSGGVFRALRDILVLLEDIKGAEHKKSVQLVCKCVEKAGYGAETGLRRIYQLLAMEKIAEEDVEDLLRQVLSVISFSRGAVEGPLIELREMLADNCVGSRDVPAVASIAVTASECCGRSAPKAVRAAGSVLSAAEEMGVDIRKVLADIERILRKHGDSSPGALGLLWRLFYSSDITSANWREMWIRAEELLDDTDRVVDAGENYVFLFYGFYIEEEAGMNACAANIEKLRQTLPLIVRMAELLNGLPEVVGAVQKKLAGEVLFLRLALDIRDPVSLRSYADKMGAYLEKGSVAKIYGMAPGIYSIDFSDGGTASNYSSVLAGGHLLSEAHGKFCFPKKKVITDLMDVEVREKSFKRFLSGAGMVAGVDPVFEGAAGRTLIFTLEDGRKIGVKLRRSGERSEDFFHEVNAMKTMRDLFPDRRDMLPVPVASGGKYFFGLDVNELDRSYGGEIRKALRAAEKSAALKTRGFGIGQKADAFIYVLPREKGYDSYAQDVKEREDMLEALSRSGRMLGEMASRGYFHTALLELFHNLDGSGRRYIWSCELDEGLGRRGAGRITAWKVACIWPNISSVGHVRDLAELRHFNEIMKEPVKYLGQDGLFLSEAYGERTEEILSLHYLGEYALSAVLLYGDWLASRRLMPKWGDNAGIEKLAGEIKDIYSDIFVSFLDDTGAGEQEKEELFGQYAALVNWERLARQMALFMTEAHAFYISKDEKEGVNEELWANFYGKEVKVGVPRLRPGTFDGGKNGRGFIGDAAETPGIREEPALGPVNGALPLQEVIKANYCLFSPLVSEKRQGFLLRGVPAGVKDLLDKLDASLFGAKGGRTLFELAVKLSGIYHLLDGSSEKAWESVEMILLDTGLSKEDLVPAADSLYSITAFCGGSASACLGEIAKLRSLVKVPSGGFFSEVDRFCRYCGHEDAAMGLYALNKVLEVYPSNMRDPGILNTFSRLARRTGNNTSRFLSIVYTELIENRRMSERNTSRLIRFLDDLTYYAGKYSCDSLYYLSTILCRAPEKKADAGAVVSHLRRVFGDRSPEDVYYLLQIDEKIWSARVSLETDPEQYLEQHISLLAELARTINAECSRFAPEKALADTLKVFLYEDVLLAIKGSADIHEAISERIACYSQARPDELFARAPGLKYIALTDTGKNLMYAGKSAYSIIRGAAPFASAGRELFRPSHLPGAGGVVPLGEIFATTDPAGKFSFEKVMGRTVVLVSGSGEKYCFKIKKAEESPEDFSAEPYMMARVRKDNSELCLPEPVPVRDGYVFRLDMSELESLYGESIREQLERSIKAARDAGKSFSLDEDLMCFIYKFPEDSSYDSYIQENSDSKAFEEAMMKACDSLGAMASDGALHTSLIELFHNYSEGGRRYIWSMSFSRAVTSSGSGRITGWRSSCVWPNISGDGEIRDWAEVADVEDIMASPEKYLGQEGLFLVQGEDAGSRNAIIMHYLGEYALSMMLLYGDWLISKEKMPHWKDESGVKELASVMRSVYGRLLGSFLAEKDMSSAKISSFLDNCVDWDIFARQMAFFMTGAHAGPVEETRNKYSRMDFWEEIYGKGVLAISAHLRPGSFDSVTGFKGDESEDARFREEPALGPVNGPMSIQEVIRANFNIFSYAVRAFSEPPSREREKPAGSHLSEAEIAGRAVEDLRRRTANIVVLPTSGEYEALQFGISRKTALKSGEYEVSVFMYGDEDGDDLSRELEKAEEELWAALSSGDLLARALVYVEASKQAEAEKQIERITEKRAELNPGVDREDLEGRFTVIPLTGISGKTLMKCAHLIIAACGILNARRFASGEYPGENLTSEQAVRLAALLKLLFANIDELGEKPLAIVRNVLSGAVLRVRKLDLTEISDYRDRQEAFLRAL